MSEKRIAKELVRIARDLVSNDPRVAGRNEVADTEGEYKNFTGIIKWGKSNGKVKNATFKLKNDGILWLDGTWENGTWKSGAWKKGTWKNGTWKNGWWYNGTWYDGTWEDGAWIDGTWDDGTWLDGTWENGTWEDGYWEDGEWKNGTWENGYILVNNKFEKSITPPESS